MFWKIIFAIYSLLLFIFGWFSAGNNDSSSLLNSNNKEALFVWGFFILSFSLFGILYGLARKIRTFSLKSVKFLIGSVVFLNLCLALIPDIYTEVNISRSLLYLIIFVIIFIIWGILLLPLYIPFISYLKRFCTYTKILKNCFFSVFAFFWAVTLLVPIFCYNIYELFKEPVSNDIWFDVLYLFTSLFVLLCFCGFILRKDFMPRKLLQWICIPLVAINLTGTSYTKFQADITEFLHYPVLLNLLVLSILILELIIIYRYVYTNMISDKSDYITEESFDESFNQK